MPLPPDLDSLAVQISLDSQCYNIWVNIFKATLTSLNIDFYRWKMREFNGVLVWFSRNEMLPSVAKSSEINLKKKNQN